jgi:hypothetical protein
MAFKIDESRIREIAQIEAEADCTIGAGGHIVGVYFPEIIENEFVILPEADSHHLPQPLLSRNEICRSV